MNIYSTLILLKIIKMGRIEIRIENKEVAIFDRYPIVVNSNEMKYIHYEVQKKQSDPKTTQMENMGCLLRLNRKR